MALRFSRKTLVPLLRVARGMKDRIDNHCTLFILIKNCIRKTAYQRPAILLVNNRSYLRHAEDRGNTCINATQKVLSQSGPPRFVPCRRLRKVGLKELWTLRWSKSFEINDPWIRAGGCAPDDWPQWMRGFKDY
jgi:hypothetical protein